MYFFYQSGSKESRWEMALASERDKILAQVKPVFTTVLDLSQPPTDNDWSKARYRGPLYFDFDDGQDLSHVCSKIQEFLGKLDGLGFDLDQARYYASGGKGFHVEIPQECFIQKVNNQGVPWLPYMYREVALNLMVDTLDLAVYTGKKGRMWRTPNIKRENGNYKVQLLLDEVMTMTPEVYAEIVSTPRAPWNPTPPSCTARLALMFDQARDKITQSMRGKKKKAEAASKILDPWKAAKKHPPTIEGLMSGEFVAEGAGFQNISMQLAIYATSVDMDLDTFLAKCDGLCQNHISDSYRYNSPERRRQELVRMWEYMQSNTLYDFEVGPIQRLLKPGVLANDLGVVAEEPKQAKVDDNGVPVADEHIGLRRGVFMTDKGIFAKGQDETRSLCRATITDITALWQADSASQGRESEFIGYQVSISSIGHSSTSRFMRPDLFTSSSRMREFFAKSEVTYQGSDAETIALMDIFSRESRFKSKEGKLYAFPREGLFVMQHPETYQPVTVYLTQSSFYSSEGTDPTFTLRYKPEQATSSYRGDIFKAPRLQDKHIPVLHNLFKFNNREAVADTLGWFVSAWMRSFYLHCFSQHPLLQVWGTAGSGKTQTMLMLAHLHWYAKESISLKSASSGTRFAIDNEVASSTSIPLLLDEYKVREMRATRGLYEKIKDVLKNTYTASEVGNRGTVNKGADNPMALIRSRATAPVVFMGEAVESETAIVERSITVALTNDRNKEWTEAFNTLQANTEAISALGHELMLQSLNIDVESFRKQVEEARIMMARNAPKIDDKEIPDRVIFNRAVIITSLRALKLCVNNLGYHDFDEAIDGLLAVRTTWDANNAQMRSLASHSRSELAKTMDKVALLTRIVDKEFSLEYGKDYLVGDGFIELKTQITYVKMCQLARSMQQRVLFDNMDAFTNALAIWSPTVDTQCLGSELRDEGSNEPVFRLDIAKMRSQGVNSFKYD